MTDTVQPVQEGSRWYDAKPAGDDFAKWFIENVRLHDGMDAKNYLPGIMLIPQTEKQKQRKRLANGSTQEVEVRRSVFVPYAKVDTRIAYFWDLCARNDWVGEVEKVVPRGAMTKLGNAYLPEGFYAIPYPKPDGSYGINLCCTAQVRIYEKVRGAIDRSHPVMLPPAATKVVEFKPPTNYDDGTNTPLKCETGAIGRALGFAGMLVIPGSGVATAEDMQEVVGISGSNAEDAKLPSGDAPAPAPAADVVDPRERIEELGAQLSEEQQKLVAAWAKEKKIDLADIKDAQVRPVLTYIERQLAA